MKIPKPTSALSTSRPTEVMLLSRLTWNDCRICIDSPLSTRWFAAHHRSVCGAPLFIVRGVEGRAQPDEFCSGDWFRLPFCEVLGVIDAPIAGVTRSKRIRIDRPGAVCSC